MFQRQLIQSLRKDIFDAFVTNIVKVQRPDTGVFQTNGAILFGKPDNTLGCPEMIQNLIAEEFSDHLMAGWSDAFRLP